MCVFPCVRVCMWVRMVEAMVARSKDESRLHFPVPRVHVNAVLEKLLHRLGLVGVRVRVRARVCACAIHTYIYT